MKKNQGLDFSEILHMLPHPPPHPCPIQHRLNLETPKRVIAIQCRPGSAAAVCGIWSGSMYAFNKNFYKTQ